MILTPDWPAPANVHAASTTRLGGCSESPFDSMNLGLHVGDNPASVERNRQLLSQSLAYAPADIQWLNQVHGTHIAQLAAPRDQHCAAIEADAAITRQSQLACCVMTADCLPVLICDQQGTQVAAVHAGWKGLLAGIVAKTIACFDASPSELLVYLAPAIGPQAFQVGPEVRRAFLTAQQFSGIQNQLLANCFSLDSSAHDERYLADIYQIARAELASVGVNRIFGGVHCTYSEPDLFFSYRRDQQCGRMASLIWLS